MDWTSIVETLIAGVVGTALMSASMGAVHLSGWANADMIRALGSLVTRKLDGSVGAGVALHFAAGILFAFPYTLVLSRFATAGFLMTLGLGLLMGVAHGIVMAIGLVTVGSRHHPVERFRGAGFEVGVAHLLGHAAYGIGVALMVEVLGIHWGGRV